jgi:hypothetical protein
LPQCSAASSLPRAALEDLHVALPVCLRHHCL